MKYINKIFSVEKVKTQDLAKKLGTPLYCYSYEKLKININSFKEYFKSFDPLVCFAVKANPNIEFLMCGFLSVIKFSCPLDSIGFIFSERKEDCSLELGFLAQAQ